MKVIRYLKYLGRHKFYVFVECAKYGEPILGLIHDMSKFSPEEFIPYMKHFYGSEKYITANGINVYPTKTGDSRFELAWFYHQKRNKHHWQWWCIPEMNKTIKAIEIPLCYRKEMIADWIGAGKATGNPDTRKWYEDRKDQIILAPETRKWIESELIKRNF